ncbi:hypothetical protein RFN28_10570 [Mesorhizobium sp. VK24D]|uniref:Uncharacterized protein n=1 Tax=Mesorhizobium album TaxID=3072314 RepID=A0ABU4XW40_9HYPH|nr:hypothetical protein [Mesorhizobium sp. VK24D]MDX8478920.1 hypothetical protein [Mesorhizobium sp. VK24D]
MADDANDVWMAISDSALEKVDRVMDALDVELGIRVTVIVDDQASWRLPHPNVMDVPDCVDHRRQGDDAVGDCRGYVRRRVFAGEVRDLKRFDVGLDLDIGPKFVPDRRLELRRETVAR